ncbi:MAG: winged helix-turn-helix domain-containing protein, partial [Terriglobales bacterium]
LFLMEQSGQVVSREQIVERIWGKNVFLDTDNSINGAIRKIRQVLSDDPEQPRFIQTITGRGYRFIAPVLEACRPDIDVPSQDMAAGGEAAGRDQDEAPRGSSSVLLPAESGAVALRARRGWAWLIVLSMAAVLVAGIATYLMRRPASGRQEFSGGRVMLAVLPFANLTGDSGQEYFSDGMTDEMITELGRLDPERLGVIARTSVMHYKNAQTPLSQIGRELGVEYVLEGSVRRDPERLRITAQLIRVKDQTHLWARQYDREPKSLLTLQSEIAGDISDEIQIALGSNRSTPKITRPLLSPDEYEAHDLYLRGRYFWNKRTRAGFEEAIAYFQQSIAKAPNYAPPYAGLADTFALMGTWSMGPLNELMPKARAAALKGLELDPTLAEAHSSLGLIAESYDYDWPSAEREFRRAIELNPAYATGHEWYAEYLSWQGRIEEALAESERARRLDPLSLIIATDNAATLY